MRNKNKKRGESISRNEHYSLKQELKLGNAATLLNLLSGLASILLSITGRYNMAIALIGASLVFDFLDGRLARRAGKATKFGTEIDSLSDIISFGAAPIIYSFMQNATIFAIIAYFLNISAGAFRLARYNIMPKKYFIGMPIPCNAILLVIASFLLPKTYWPFITILSAILMASPFKIKKL